MTAFTLGHDEKITTLLPRLNALTAHHRRACAPYDNILSALDVPTAPASSLADLPWLPVRMFKTHRLSSIPPDQVYRVLTSSGTTGDVSRVYLDGPAALEQSRALARTFSPVIGEKRLPMLLIDSNPATAAPGRNEFTARSAGVLGLAPFGRNHAYALNPDGSPDVNAIKHFLANHGGRPFLIFGFTFMVWLYLYEVARDEGLDLSNGTLIHSGGWKKLVDRAVTNDDFRTRFKQDTGLTRIFNFYGMVEQIGTIFLEGPEGGSLYCPDFAHVIIRDPLTWDEVPHGTPGLIELMSTLPTSYPGHVLMTEDTGLIDGVDDGEWPGTRIQVLGRLPRAEARGCSDTFTGGGAA